MLFVLALFTIWQAIQVRSALNDVAIRVSALGDALAAGRHHQVDENLDAAAHSAAKARANTRGPVWFVASRLPWVGDDVTAVRTVADVARDLTDETLPDLVDAGNRFGPAVLKPRGGRIAIDKIPAVQPDLDRGAAGLADASDRVDVLDTSGLVTEVRGPVVELQDKLGTASNVAKQAATAARLLPPMLGADGARNYLLLFQNNAEARAQGGLPGAIAVLTARDGFLQMNRQTRPGEIGTFPDGIVRLTADERELFTERLGIYPQDATFVPDFARSSAILRQMYQARLPERIDGVISVDPVALSYMLRGTGPLKLSSGTTLTADNAASYLMNQVYKDVPDPVQQDALFADAARRSFQALITQVRDPKALLAGLSQAATERRLMLWSSRPDEEKEIVGTSIAGLLPTREANRPEVGVYVNDSSADKLSYYLDWKADVTASSCDREGRQRLAVRLTARSTVPKGATLPAAIVGPSRNPVPPGVLLHSFYVYAPVGGYVDSARSAGSRRRRRSTPTVAARSRRSPSTCSRGRSAPWTSCCTAGRVRRVLRTSSRRRERGRRGRGQCRGVRVRECGVRADATCEGLPRDLGSPP